MTSEENKSSPESGTSNLQHDVTGEETKRLRHLSQKVSADHLLKQENWPMPKWYSEKRVSKIGTYEALFTFELRTRYLELETDFRCLLGNFPDETDTVTSDRIADLLHSAREGLEQGTVDLLTISSSLDLVERYLVWLYPPWTLKARIDGIVLRLESLSFNGIAALREKLEGLSKSEKEMDPRQTRSVLDEALRIIISEVVQGRIDRGLQTDRLRNMRFWGMIVLLVFFLTVPLATDRGKIAGWPSDLIVGQRDEVYVWMNGLAMMVLGAVGGFLSGLLQVRSTQVAASEYLLSGIRLQLRPLVGALIALILYTILSWQVLHGITIVNAGSCFLIAFLSGFSERYFLRLLKTENENGNEQAKAWAKAQGSAVDKAQPEEKK